MQETLEVEGNGECKQAAIGEAAEKTNHRQWDLLEYREQASGLANQRTGRRSHDKQTGSGTCGLSAPETQPLSSAENTLYKALEENRQ